MPPNPTASTEKRTLDQILARVDSLDRALRGSNGDEGLISKVISHLNMSSNRETRITKIEHLIWGDPDKGVDSEGLIDRVNEHDKFYKNLSKIYWSVVGAIVLLVVNLIVQIAYHISQTPP